MRSREKGRFVDDCIFCRIARGEVPVHIIWEDAHAIAFDDNAPQAPVHTLIVSRAHYVNLNDDIPTAVLVSIFGAVSKVARVKGIAESGYRVIVNNGPDASQTVQHLHVHVLGGRAMGQGMLTFADG